MQDMIDEIELLIAELQAEVDHYHSRGPTWGRLKGYRAALAIIRRRLGDGAWVDVRTNRDKPPTCQNCRLSRFARDSYTCRADGRMLNVTGHVENNTLCSDCPAQMIGGHDGKDTDKR